MSGHPAGQGTARLPSLLARFGGERPAATDWVAAALALEPERSRFDAGGASIECLIWGPAGAPGLLFLHGNRAHADWWSFIAPFFAEDFRCAAISWSGMGGSDWRGEYSLPTFLEEMRGAVAHAGLARAGAPIAIGHSFGGIPLMQMAVDSPGELGGGIMVDSVAPRAPRQLDPAMQGGRPKRVYTSLADALARYRFAPPQPSAYPDIVDHLARGSLHRIEASDDRPAGWTWRFDPRFQALAVQGFAPAIEHASIPMGLIHGAKSALVDSAMVAALAQRLPDCRFAVAIPEARHHLMVDQPIALVSALRVGIAALRSTKGQK